MKMLNYFPSKITRILYVCNLDLYSDTIHYSEEVNSYMLKEMKCGHHLLTQENYTEYLDNIRAFYSKYNYDQLFLNTD